MIQLFLLILSALLVPSASQSSTFVHRSATPVCRAFFMLVYCGEVVLHARFYSLCAVGQLRSVVRTCVCVCVCVCV